MIKVVGLGIVFDGVGGTWRGMTNCCRSVEAGSVSGS